MRALIRDLVLMIACVIAGGAAVLAYTGRDSVLVCAPGHHAVPFNVENTRRVWL